MTEKRSPDPECYLCDGEGRIYTSDSWWDCPICTDEDCLDAAKARIAELESLLDLLGVANVPKPLFAKGQVVVPKFNTESQFKVTGATYTDTWRYYLENVLTSTREDELQSLDSSAKEE